jgi:WD40 repeat protein
MKTEARDHDWKTCWLVVACLGLVTPTPLMAQEPTVRATLKGHSDVWCIAISSDGKLVASGSKDGTVKLWDTTTGKEKMTLTGQPTAVTVGSRSVRSVAFSSDSKLLASGDNNGTVRLWDLATGKEKATLGPRNDGRGKEGHIAGHGILSLSFGGEDKLLASGSDDFSAVLWDVTTGKEKTRIAHVGGMTLALSPDGKLLATALNSNGKDLKLWDTATGKEKASFTHTRVANWAAVTFSGDGKFIASANNDATVSLWNPATGKELVSLTTSNKVGNVTSYIPLTCVAMTGDGKLLVSADQAGIVRLWDVVPAGEKATLKERAVLKGCSASMALSTDGRLLVSGSPDGTLKLWDIAATKGSDK